MLLKIKNLLLSNSTIKLSALFIGFTLWSILNESQQARTTLAVPVCFYNIPDHCSITAPESVTITLAGKHTSLRTLNTKTLAAHIDAKTLLPGTNVIDMTSEQLMLPPQINLVKYKPLRLRIEARKLTTLPDAERTPLEASRSQTENSTKLTGEHLS